MSLTDTRPALHIRRPAADDGAAVWNLVREAGGLDVNSAYAYILLCDRFAGTCAVAETGGRLAGFVSAFLQPDRPDTLFVWQIAVHPSARGRGIGASLLGALLRRPACAGVRRVEATVSPDNAASQALFRRFAQRLGAPLERLSGQGYAAGLFPAGTAHEDEWLFRIGPMSPIQPETPKTEGGTTD